MMMNMSLMVLRGGAVGTSQDVSSEKNYLKLCVQQRVANTF